MTFGHKYENHWSKDLQIGGQSVSKSLYAAIFVTITSNYPFVVAYVMTPLQLYMRHVHNTKF